MNKDTLSRYIELSLEAETVHEQLEKVETRIERCRKQLRVMRENGTVKDRVYGGEGGIQGYNIEGFPNTKYAEIESRLRCNLEKLKQLHDIYAETEFNLLSLTDDILVFVNSIPDCDGDVRLIARLRCFDGLSWQEIADRMGGNYTDESVRKRFYRYVNKNQKS